MTFVESEMSRRNWSLAGDMNLESKPTSSRMSDQWESRSKNLNVHERQPASLGKLHEIDLGMDSKLQNIARTEAATKSLHSYDQNIDSFDNTSHRGVLGLRRGRNRRNSEDIARDKLVEQVLRESKREQVNLTKL